MYSLEHTHVREGTWELHNINPPLATLYVTFKQETIPIFNFSTRSVQIKVTTPPESTRINFYYLPTLFGRMISMDCFWWSIIFIRLFFRMYLSELNTITKLF